MRQRDQAAFNPNFSEHPCVFLFQRGAAAFEIFEDPFKFLAGEVAKGVGAVDQGENIVYRDWLERREADHVLSYDVVGFFLDLDRVESPFSNQLRGNDGFDEIVDVRGDEHAVTAAVERMSRPSDSLE